MKLSAAVAILALVASGAAADQKLNEAIAKAEEQVKKGKNEEAVRTLEKAAKDNPVEGLVALSRLQDRIGRVADAAATAARAVEAAGAAAPAVKAEALANLAFFDLRRSTGKEALSHAEQAVAAQETPYTLEALADAQARASDPSKALATAQKAAQASPGSAFAQEALGTAFATTVRLEEAVTAFRKAIELDPKLTRARVGLVSALVLQGKNADAVAEGRKAVELDPESGEALAVLGAALVVQDAKNWGEAIAKAQEGKFKNDRSAFIHHIVGRIFEANGDLGQAASAYAEATNIDPGYTPSQAALIYILIRRGELEKAQAAAERLTKEQPGSGEAFLRLGEIRLRRNDNAGAVPVLEIAVKAMPGSAEAQYYLGRAYQFTNKLEPAAAAYKKAVEAAPDNTTYRTTYGLALGLLDQEEAGIAELQKVVQTPSYKGADAYINLGWLYRNMSPPKTDESIKAYSKAVEIDPKNAQTFLGLGWAYSYAKQYDQAIGAYQKALEADPKLDGQAYTGMAWCHFFKRDLEKTKATMAKAEAAGAAMGMLKDNIQKYERAVAEGARERAEAQMAEAQRARQAEGPDLATLVRKLNNKDAKVRKGAVEQMRVLGKEAVPYLGHALSQDPELEVRRAALTVLNALGCAAKDATKQASDAMAAPLIDIQADKKALERELQEADFRRDVRTLIEKLQKCS